VVGASAGGPSAIGSLLESLGYDFGPPVIIVQHVHRHDDGSVASSLRGRGCDRAEEAVDQHEIEPGGVYVAPAGYHLLVDDTSTLSLSLDAPELHSRPSIDVLFESGAAAFGAALAAVVLSGASEDGARGLLAVAAEGGRCYVQSPDSADCATMPKAALRQVPQAEALPVEEIGRRLRAVATEAMREDPRDS
jgi:two-component system chemotaxis response regulator CheB